MSISSVPDNYSITLNDSILNDTITLDTSTWANMSSASGGFSNITITGAVGVGTYTTSYGIGAGGGSTFSGISSIDLNSTIFRNEEWVDSFPDFERIEKMCKEYPGLAIAFEKFKTTYKLVKDHYDTPEDQRPKP